MLYLLLTAIEANPAGVRDNNCGVRTGEPPGWFPGWDRRQQLVTDPVIF